LPWHRRHGRSFKAPAVRARRGWPAAAAARAAIYYVVIRRQVLYLIDIYAKSEKENLTNAEKREVRKLVSALEAAT
jgi:hypothetical protein